jgi:hypothetical protein
MTRYKEINIEGWWTINFMGNYEGMGCVICNIKEDTDFIPETEGDRKYIFRLKDSKDITKYKFRDSIGILNQNKIKSWDIVDADGTDFSEDLGNVYGKVSLDNRFIRLFSEKSKKFDKDCEYIKKWIPELKDIPNKEIHEWEKYSDKYDIYLQPVRDYKEGREASIKMYKAVL